MTRTWPWMAGVIALAVAPAGAGASETIGSGLTATALGSVVCGSPQGCTMVQTDLSGRPLATSEAGVATRWRLRFPSTVPAQSVQLEWVRLGPGGYNSAGLAGVATVQAGQRSVEVPTRSVAPAGTRLAVRLDQDEEIGFAMTPAARFVPFIPPLGAAAELPDFTGVPGNTELLMNATIEPDIDEDELGDETQDLLVMPPGQSRMRVGRPARFELRLSRLAVDATLIVVAPRHAPLRGITVDGASCPRATPVRAVCTIHPPGPQGSRSATLAVRALVRPRTRLARVRKGASFTATLASGAVNNVASWTASISAPPCSIPVRGTRRADRLRGSRYGDRILGGRGRDVLKGNGGRDCMSGGPGDDRLVANDGRRDRVRCGAGRHDVAIVDRRDRVSGCEVVRRRRR